VCECVFCLAGGDPFAVITSRSAHVRHRATSGLQLVMNGGVKDLYRQVIFCSIGVYRRSTSIVRGHTAQMLKYTLFFFIYIFFDSTHIHG